MSIIFENIDPKNNNENGAPATVSIDKETNGKWYRAMLAAIINSSNLGPNSDRGQDYSWRLAVEQQAIIEAWQEQPEMVGKVAEYTKVMADSLGDLDFLDYLLYQQELGQSPEKSNRASIQAAEDQYKARVAAAKASVGKAAPVATPEPEVEIPTEPVSDVLNQPEDLPGFAKVTDDPATVTPKNPVAPVDPAPVAEATTPAAPVEE